MNRLKLLS